MAKKSEYITPCGPYIGSHAQILYRLEDQRDKAVRKAAEEQGRLMGYTREQFWTHSLSEGLLSTLNHWDTRAAELAAIAYLERRGYEVRRLGGDL